MQRLCFILLFSLCCFYLVAQKHTMNVATFNLRYDSKEDSIDGNGWKQRYPVAAQLIRFHDFDIMGTQECFHHQLNDLEKELPGYKYIGVGRDDGKTEGEYAAIFYKENKFNLLKEGNFWLSENTEIPNKGWDAVCIRICTWGEFQEIETGLRFFFFNLHMDHIGVEARKNSAQLILNKIKTLTNGEPVILTGDFNVDQNNESYHLLNTSGVLKDAYELADICYATNGTFTGFDPNTKTDSRIDHIFLTKNFHVLRYGILTDSYRSKTTPDASKTKKKDAPQEISFGKYTSRLPSDHFPVMVQVCYEANDH